MPRYRPCPATDSASLRDADLDHTPPEADTMRGAAAFRRAACAHAHAVYALAARTMYRTMYRQRRLTKASSTTFRRRGQRLRRRRKAPRGPAAGRLGVVHPVGMALTWTTSRCGTLGGPARGPRAEAR